MRVKSTLPVILLRFYSQHAANPAINPVALPGCYLTNFVQDNQTRAMLNHFRLILIPQAQSSSNSLLTTNPFPNL